MLESGESDYVLPSHPSWVRGLKLAEKVAKIVEKASHPTRVRGLKRHRDSLFEEFVSLFNMRARIEIFD